MKRTLFTAMVAVMVVGSALLAQGHPHIGTAISGHIHSQTCRYARADGEGGWSHREVKLGIRCAVRHWSVPGGADYAIGVAKCESGLNAHAVSPSGAYQGLFQQSVVYWPSRFHALAPRRFHLDPWVQNARSNFVISIRMAHASGWGAWGCP